MNHDLRNCILWLDWLNTGEWAVLHKYDASCTYLGNLLHFQTALRRYIRENRTKEFEVLNVFPAWKNDLIPIGSKRVLETGATEAWIKLYDLETKAFIFLYPSELDQGNTEVLAYFPWSTASSRPSACEDFDPNGWQQSTGGTQEQQEELWSSIEAHLTGGKTIKGDSLKQEDTKEKRQFGWQKKEPLKCNQWLAEQYFDFGRTNYRELLPDWKRIRKEQDYLTLPDNPLASMRTFINEEKERRRLQT